MIRLVPNPMFQDVAMIVLRVSHQPLRNEKAGRQAGDNKSETRANHT